MTELYNVVMLPTEKASPLFIDVHGELSKRADNANAQAARTQHIYILSDKPVSTGSWYLDTVTNQIYKAGLFVAPTMRCFKEIIASTDKFLTPNSWIHESFLTPFIKAYNSGKPITKVYLEVKFDENSETEIKTRVGGSVIIQRTKEYSQADVDKMFDELTTHLTRDYHRIDDIGLAISKWRIKRFA